MFSEYIGSFPLQSSRNNHQSVNKKCIFIQIENLKNFKNKTLNDQFICSSTLILQITTLSLASQQYLQSLCPSLIAFKPKRHTNQQHIDEFYLIIIIRIAMEVQQTNGWWPTTWTQESTDQTLNGLQREQLMLNYQFCQQITQQNEALFREVEIAQKEVNSLKQNNFTLRTSLEEQQGKEKRRYSKRRTWLEKKFVCPHSNCDSKYSSKISLNNHQRKKHQSQINLD